MVPLLLRVSRGILPQGMICNDDPITKHKSASLIGWRMRWVKGGRLWWWVRYSGRLHNDGLSSVGKTMMIIYT